MTRRVKVKNTYIGGGAPITVQSMCNTKTFDVAATVEQILSLERAGCDLVRVAVKTIEDARAIAYIKKEITIPLAADVHFDYKLALAAAESGADKIRINPGNIGGEDKVKMVADCLGERGIPIRIGVNGGSLGKEYKGQNRVPAMVESALSHISILEKVGFYNTVAALKSSSVSETAEANRLFHAKSDYPLHLGITEAGTLERGLIKSSAGIGSLLLSGIGDTIRYSLTSPDLTDEVFAGRYLLNALGLRRDMADVVCCPTCGRTEIDVNGLARQVERLAAELNKNIKIAVMGCVVNGIGEGADADVGVAGGKEKSVIFKKGEIVKTVPNQSIYEELKKIIAEL